MSKSRITPKQLTDDAAELAKRGNFDDLAIAGDLSEAARELQRLRIIESLGIGWLLARRKLDEAVDEHCNGRWDESFEPHSEVSYCFGVLDAMIAKLTRAFEVAERIRNGTAR